MKTDEQPPVPYFRGWHKGLNKMLYPPDEFQSNNICAFSDGSTAKIDLPSHLGGVLRQNITAIMSWDGRCYVWGTLQDIDWMQWTGRNDTNGKKIFRNDIVKHRMGKPWITPVHISRVIWSNEWHSYYLWDGASTHRMRDDMAYEVLGNTYENPDMQLERYVKQEKIKP